MTKWREPHKLLSNSVLYRILYACAIVTQCRQSRIDDPETNTVAKGNVTRDIIAAPEGAGRNGQATTPE